MANAPLGSQEHYEAIAMFERIFKGRRFDKEDKAIQAAGHVYQNGETDELFKAFLHGYTYGKAENA